MLKLYLYLCILLLIVSCKTINIKADNIIQSPPLRVRLIESENYNKSNLKYQTEYINVADSINIETWTISTEHPENCFYFFVPNVTIVGQCGDFMEKLAQKTNSKVIGVQYRGYNYSDGIPTFKNCITDNDIIYKYYKTKNINYKTINLIGISLGTVFAPKLARIYNSDIDNVILLSTFSTPQSLLKQYKKSVPSIAKLFVKLKGDKTFYDLNNVESLKDFGNGVLVVQAKDDRTTDYSFAVELIEKIKTKKKELMTLDDGGHFAFFLAKYVDKVVEKISDFISK